MADRERGTVETVVRFDDGAMRFGFVRPDAVGADIFILPRDLPERDCEPGDRLTYSVVTEPRGLRAVGARPES